MLVYTYSGEKIHVDHTGGYYYIYEFHVKAVDAGGESLWDYMCYSYYTGNSIPIFANDLRYFTGTYQVSPTATQTFKLGCLNLSGKLVWTVALPDLTYTAPFACSNAVLVYTNRYIYSFNGKNGALNWNASVDSTWNVPYTPLSYYPAVNPDGTAFYVTVASQLSAYTCQGGLLWHYDVSDGYSGSSKSSPVVSASGDTIYVAAHGNINGSYKAQFYAVDYLGAELWQTDPYFGTYIDNVEPASPAVGNGMLIASMQEDICAYSTSTGELLWCTATRPLPYDCCGAFALPVTIDAAGLIYAPRNWQVTAYNGSTQLDVYSPGGEVVWTTGWMPDQFGISEVLISYGGSVYWTTQAVPTYDNFPPYITLRRFADDVVCDAGYYNPVDTVQTTCTKCAYPYTNLTSGKTDCPNTWLRFRASIVIIVLAAMTFIVTIAVLSGERKFAIFLIILSPTVDFFSDVAYIMTNKFYNMPLLISAITFVMVSVVLFAAELCVSKRYPACMLAMPVYAAAFMGKFAPAMAAGAQYLMTLFAAFHGAHMPESLTPQWADLSELHGLLFNIAVGIWLSLVWSVMNGVLLLVFLLRNGAASLALSGYLCIASAVAGLVASLALIVRPALVLAWFLLGAVLHMTKTLCIGRVWYFWVRGWGLATVPQGCTVPEFDTFAYNSGVLAEFLLESFPQLVLQSMNNTYIGTWSPIAILSTVVSVYMTLDGFYKMSFALCVRRSPFEDIAVKPPVLSWVVKGTEMQPCRLEVGDLHGDTDTAAERTSFI